MKFGFGHVLLFYTRSIVMRHTGEPIFVNENISTENLFKMSASEHKTVGACVEHAQTHTKINVY